MMLPVIFEDLTQDYGDFVKCWLRYGTMNFCCDWPNWLWKFHKGTGVGNSEVETGWVPSLMRYLELLCVRFSVGLISRFSLTEDWYYISSYSGKILYFCRGRELLSNCLPECCCETSPSALVLEKLDLWIMHCRWCHCLEQNR